MVMSLSEESRQWLKYHAHCMECLHCNGRGKYLMRMYPKCIWCKGTGLEKMSASHITAMDKIGTKYVFE